MTYDPEKVKALIDAADNITMSGYTTPDFAYGKLKAAREALRPKAAIEKVLPDEEPDWFYKAILYLLNPRFPIW